jgi:hypothetical protein
VITRLAWIFFLPYKANTSRRIPSPLSLPSLSPLLITKLSRPDLITMSYNNVYDGFEYDDYNVKDDSLPLGDDISFGLSEYVGGAADMHGALKSKFKTNDGNLAYWNDDKAGFTISVEWLLQTDGYADRNKKGL